MLQYITPYQIFNRINGVNDRFLIALQVSKLTDRIRIRYEYVSFSEPIRFYTVVY